MSANSHHPIMYHVFGAVTKRSDMTDCSVDESKLAGMICKILKDHRNFKKTLTQFVIPAIIDKHEIQSVLIVEKEVVLRVDAISQRSKRKFALM